MPLRKGPPLDQITGYVTLGNSSSDISTQALRGFSEFKDDQIDKIIYLDNRTFGPFVNTCIFLVEPYRHGEIPLHIHQPCFYYLITHTIPWVVVIIGEGTKQQEKL